MHPVLRTYTRMTPAAAKYSTDLTSCADTDDIDMMSLMLMTAVYPWGRMSFLLQLSSLYTVYGNIREMITEPCQS